ncbi:Fic family protein [Nocardioides sp. J9]|nr:Fic family protein [Nocardioides sp. J9]
MVARWERVQVEPDYAATSRAERRGGSYLRYHPDELAPCGAPARNELSSHVVEHAADTTTALQRLGDRLRANPFRVLYTTALRSESISSSFIEGIHATARDVAFAHLRARDESLRADGSSAHVGQQVTKNARAMERAVELLGAGPWRHEHIWDIHQALLPWQRRGYRQTQVWVGGTTALTADYAAPPHQEVHAYVDDLLGYVNTSGDLPVVAAALVHAQFETIHPFEDGNGRVGRALVHGVFKRAGLVDGGVAPLSTALREDRDGYVEALTRYRYDGRSRKVRQQALDGFVDRFLDYLDTAVAAADRFVDAALALHGRWRTVVAGTRADGVLHKALDVVVDYPVLTTRLLAEQLDVTPRRGEDLVKQLVRAGIVRPGTGKYRRAAVYQSDAILDLLDLGAEATPTTTHPALAMQASEPLVQRCGGPTAHGTCQNRVTERGERCWRHRT